MKMKWVVRLILVLVILALAAVSLIGPQAIRDWLLLRGYTPSAEIAALASRTTMTEEARRYFYMSHPETNDKSEFNQNCTTEEKALVLGCYTPQRQIYVLEVDRPDLDGIMEVTAAHEMLHAAYDRMPERERREVVELLEAEFKRIDDTELSSLVASYEDRGGEEAREDELHSILPTQVDTLSPELEEYYAQYFSDRQTVVALYQQYKHAFTQAQDRIEGLQSRVEELRADIELLEQQLQQEQEEINELNTRLERLQEAEDEEEYNRLVPRQNRAVDTYNTTLESYNARINEHNRVVEELNDSVLLQQDLVDSIDSRQTIPGT